MMMMARHVLERSLALCLAGSFLLPAGCKHHSQIEIQAPGAAIEALDTAIQIQGNTVEARSGFPESHPIRVSAPGYQTREVILQKAYRADLSLVLILFGVIPYFFTARLEDRYIVQLQPLGAPIPAPAPGPPPLAPAPQPEPNKPQPEPSPEPSPEPQPEPGPPVVPVPEVHEFFYYPDLEAYHCAVHDEYYWRMEMTGWQESEFPPAHLQFEGARRVNVRVLGDEPTDLDLSRDRTLHPRHE